MAQGMTRRASLLLGLGAMAPGLGRAEEAAVAVVIEEFAFTPAEIKITRGTKVVWTNKDDEPHTVSDATAKKAFKSQALDKGETFSLVFQEAGTFAYFCSLHPHMMGTVVVT